MTAPDRPIRILLSLDAPPAPPGTVFGLQDHDGELEEGRREADGSLAFACDVRAVALPDGAIRLRGPFVHGPPDGPFLYLSCRPATPERDRWLFRLKVPLTGIDPDAECVAGRIKATGGGSVPLVDGWVRVDA